MSSYPPPPSDPVRLGLIFPESLTTRIVRFASLAATAPRVLPTSEVKVILGVDRLDYTKGEKCFSMKVIRKFF